jgi:hypothetical protein
VRSRLKNAILQKERIPCRNVNTRSIHQWTPPQPKITAAEECSNKQTKIKNQDLFSDIQLKLIAI